MDISVEALATRQFEDYRRGSPGSYFAEDHAPLTIEDAYAVQRQIALLRCRNGESIIGYKVGCIGTEVQGLVRLEGPIRGYLFDSEVRRSGERLRHSSFVNLAIEGEMAARIGADGKIASVFPVIELHNFVFRGNGPSLPELIVNNGLNAGIVMPEQDPELHAAAFETLEVAINGSARDSGPPYPAAWGPAKTLAWLESHLRDHGLGIERGQIVLTGTSLGLYRLQPGDSVRVVARPPVVAATVFV